MLIEKARAKINIGLWIRGKLEDGYHQVSSLLLPLDIYDNISIAKAEAFEIEGPNFGQDDLMFKAFSRMESHTKKSLPIRIQIEKKIPLGAGLAGGTADGAAILRALNSLYNLGYSLEDLEEISRSLGVDFAYCIHNRSALARGKGDRLEFMDPFEGPYCLLVNPGFSISTKEAYSWVKSYSKEDHLLSCVQSLYKKDYEALRGLAKNDLEEGVLEKHPIIGRIKEDLYNSGAEFASMSGSGPTVYGLFSHKDHVQKAYEDLRETYPIVVATSLLGGENNG